MDVSSIALVWYQTLLLPVSFILSLSITLAAFNKSLRIRELYVLYLHRVFKLSGKIVEKLEGSDRKDDKTPARRSKSRTKLISRRDELILQPFGVSNAWIPSAKEAHVLTEILSYVQTGISSIIEDEVTPRFETEELRYWNLLTRTFKRFHFTDLRLLIIYLAGLFFRYFFAFPIRLSILLLSICIFFIINVFNPLISNSKWRRYLYDYGTLVGFRVLSRAFSSVVYFHNSENKPKNQSLCVANHTSPIDVIILSCDRNYTMVGQKHSGFFGWFQGILSRGASHIWFQRAEMKDRQTVAKTLQSHVKEPGSFPICIFPEGTCINNTSVMQFKKGCFEISETIVHPVAIKYDPFFGDPFWNSAQDGMLKYFFKMMTSWAIVVNVWYLPPTTRLSGETSIEFANRVKELIARQGGLKNLMWDGNLKRNRAKSEWKVMQQNYFYDKIKSSCLAF